MSESEPIMDRPGARLERDVRPRNARRCESAHLEALRCRTGFAAHDARLPADHHHGGLRPAVDTDEVSRLDAEPGLFERLTDGALVSGFVDLEKAARLRP